MVLALLGSSMVLATILGCINVIGSISSSIASLLLDLKYKKGRRQTQDAFRILHLTPTLVSRIHRREDDDPLDIQLCAGTFFKNNHTVRCRQSKNSGRGTRYCSEHNRCFDSLQRYAHQRFALWTLLRNVDGSLVPHAQYDRLVIPVVGIEIKAPGSALRACNFPSVIVRTNCTNLDVA